MRRLPDRYKTVGRRNFRAAIERLLETEFKLVGSHRVIRLIAEAIHELHQEFYPELRDLEPGTVLWATTKAGEGAKVSWGKRAEDYGIQMVRLPLVTKAEIESRMMGGPGRDPKDNRRKEFHRDTATMVRLVKSAAQQGGLLTGAELSVLMNRSLSKIHEYIRTYERETGDPLPLKGYVLDMGSSPTHKGIICRKYEEGLSPPDIARTTGHSQSAVDNYLGTYERIRLLLRKRFDAPTICQVTGKAARTVAEYLVIVQGFHPELLQNTHRDWLTARRKRNHRAFRPAELCATMVERLEKPTSQGSQGKRSRKQRPRQKKPEAPDGTSRSPEAKNPDPRRRRRSQVPQERKTRGEPMSRHPQKTKKKPRENTPTGVKKSVTGHMP
jgi:hypothetical protein